MQTHLWDTSHTHVMFEVCEVWGYHPVPISFHPLECIWSRYKGDDKENLVITIWYTLCWVHKYYVCFSYLTQGLLLLALYLLKWGLGLERCLKNYESLLLLQMTGIQFPAPIVKWLTTLITPISGICYVPLTSRGTVMYAEHIHMCRQTFIYKK